MVELSIIVPVYNVRGYIQECMDSLLKIEKVKKQIICVDDVSTDGTSELLINKYGNFPNVEIIKNDKNSGLAFCRNAGLEHAGGKYVMFVDSDDYICSDNVFAFVKRMNEEALDILYYDVKEFFDSEKKDIISNRRIRRGRYTIGTGAEIFNSMVHNGEMFGCVWDGIYRKEFLLDNCLRFINGTLHEDIPFTFKAMLSADRVDVINQIGYYYRQRENSILHQPNYLKRAQGLIIGYCQMMTVWQSLIEKAEIVKIESSIIEYTNSVVSMIESNFQKIDDKSGYNDPILGSFLMNFEINKYRKFSYMKESGFISKLESYNSIGFYGAGKIAEEIIPFLLNEGVKLSSILVSDLKGNKTNLCGITVVPFDIQVKKNFDAIIVGVAGQLKNEITTYIADYGFSGEIIALPIQ